MSATISLFHIVINTLGREMTIPDVTSDHLYRYITVIIKNRNCKPFRINGIGNHIHLLVGLSASVALGDLVRDIKQGSSKWAKQQYISRDSEAGARNMARFRAASATRMPSSNTSTISVFTTAKEPSSRNTAT